MHGEKRIGGRVLSANRGRDLGRLFGPPGDGHPVLAMQGRPAGRGVNTDDVLHSEALALHQPDQRVARDEVRMGDFAEYRQPSIDEIPNRGKQARMRVDAEE